MKPRSPIARISPKKLKALGGHWPGSTAKRSSKQIKKKPRSRHDFARIYGSEERTSWVTRQPCAGCGKVPGEFSPSHNHHTKTGGTSRKGDYDTIIPLCQWCHVTLHALGADTFSESRGIDLEKCAKETQRRWVAFQEAV